MTSACWRCYLLYRGYKLIGNLDPEWILSSIRVFVVYILPLFGVTFLLEFPFFYIPFEFFPDFDTISHPTMQYCVHRGRGIYGPLPILFRIFNIFGLGIEFIF